MAGRKIPYPWGRLRPERRIAEIEEAIERHRRQKDVLRHQFEASLKKLDMNISALSDQVEVAKSFQEEDRWSELRERVFALELEGIDAMEAITGRSLSEAEVVVSELEKGSEVDRPTPGSSVEDEDFLMSSAMSVNDLFEGE